MNYGFIGGCINHQKGIPSENLFYNVFLKQLPGSVNHNHISLAGYLSYDQLPQRVHEFIRKKKPDHIFLFIRPFPLMPLHKPVIKFDKQNKKIGYAFHPGLFSRKLNWKNDFSEYQSSGNFQFIPKKIFSWRDINLLAGLLSGLQFWSLQYLKMQIESVKKQCDAHNIRFTVISPPKNPESVMGNFICRRIAKKLLHYCEKSNIGYINIFSITEHYFEPDKIHFNIEGHTLVGQLIYEKLSGELPSIAEHPHKGQMKYEHAFQGSEAK